MHSQPGKAIGYHGGMRITRRALAVLALATPMPARAAPAAFEALFAPSARLWERWTAHDPGSTRRLDHAALGRVLAALVRPGADGIARVAYGAAGPGQRSALEGAIAAMQAVPVSTLNRAEQFAFWANLYNAVTLRVVLSRYPVRSIRDIDISPGLFARGPWDARLVEVEGQALTLNDIEHRILRPVWRDPRVHYAVNCASLGCPDLRAEAWTGEGLGAQLDRAAAAFIGHPRGVSVTAEGLVLSSLYNWFAEDFGGAAGVRTHLLAYAPPALATAIRAAPDRVSYRYDWALNDAG